MMTRSTVQCCPSVKPKADDWGGWVSLAMFCIFRIAHKPGPLSCTRGLPSLPTRAILKLKDGTHLVFIDFLPIAFVLIEAKDVALMFGLFITRILHWFSSGSNWIFECFFFLQCIPLVCVIQCNPELVRTLGQCAPLLLPYFLCNVIFVICTLSLWSN